MRQSSIITTVLVIVLAAFVLVGGLVFSKREAALQEIHPAPVSPELPPSEPQEPLDADREEVTLHIGEKGHLFGVAIIPEVLLEDSRCPIDVTCIQAGTVRVRVKIGMDEEDHELQLMEPLLGKEFSLALVRVMPDPQSEKTIDLSAYLFTFEGKKSGVAKSFDEGANEVRVDR